MNKRLLYILFFISAYTLSDAAYEIKARLESVRKGDSVTLVFASKPEEKKYRLRSNDTNIADIEILSFVKTTSGRFRVSASYRLLDKEFEVMLKAGSEVVLFASDEGKNRDYSSVAKRETFTYKKNIISEVDNREMVLVPSGKFIFGSNSGDRDEFPEQAVHLPDFYIDKFEVSNRDFLVYIKKTNTPPPGSWENGVFPEELADFPVLVTYHEAAAYAKWAGKNLPTERQWEKGARGPGKAADDDNRNFIYPWGERFLNEKSNCIEFWNDQESGIAIKKLYKKGLLPVHSFSDYPSPYGAVNMAGNAAEWTRSWYMPYKGNKTGNNRYGKQYKVVRGGAWFQGSDKLRATNREIGGSPNLYKDNSAGFRCVKNVYKLDKSESDE